MIRKGYAGIALAVGALVVPIAAGSHADSPAPAYTGPAAQTYGDAVRWCSDTYWRERDNDEFVDCVNAASRAWYGVDVILKA